MKKKLLAVVLSVVMIAALLVPMMAISAASTATISLGTPYATTRTGSDGVVSNVIAVDVSVSGNTDEQGFFTARYKIISEEGLEMYFSDHKIPAKAVQGFDEGDYTDGTSSFKTTAGRLSEGGKTWFQIVQDSTNAFGIYADAGKLVTVYFVMPEKIGTYNFTLEWMDGTDDGYAYDDAKPQQYDMSVAPATATYTVECKSHVAGEPVVTKEATCTEDGAKVTSCSVCGAEMKKETIAKLGHDLDDGTVADNVKCGDTADTVYACEREGCDYTETKTGAKVDHAMVADEANSKAATCEEDGVEAKKCSREGCDHKETKTIAKLGHALESDQAAGEAPTCTEDGKVVDKCTNEGCDKVEETVIPALGHDWDESAKEIDKRPTAEEEGNYKVPCTRCKAKSDKPIAKLAAEVENDGLTVKTEGAVLPEDIALVFDEDSIVEDGNKISAKFTFGSDLADLTGVADIALDAEGVKNVKIVNAAGEEIEVVLVDGKLTFSADLAAEYTISYEMVKNSPDTSDASNTVVFAVMALIAVAGLVVVGKKRFAL